MNILIVGEQRNTFTLARLLRCFGNHAFHHFRSSRDALKYVRGKGHGHGFDFALLEKTEQSQELIRLLRQGNHNLPITILDHCVAPDAFLPRLLTAWERSKKGKRVLNCMLTPRVSAEDQSCPLQTEDIVFEFAAPCRRFNLLDRGSSERPCA